MGDSVENVLLWHGLQSGYDELFTSDGLFRVGRGDWRGWLLGTVLLGVLKVGNFWRILPASQALSAVVNSG